MSGWAYKFVECLSEALAFLDSLDHQQAVAAKIGRARKLGYDIYGWEIFYPKVGPSIAARLE